MCESDVMFLWGHILESRPVDCGQLVQLGTKVLSPVGKQLIFLGPVVKVVIRLRLGLS